MSATETLSAAGAEGPLHENPDDVAGAAGTSARILVLRRVVTMIMFAGSTLVLARVLSIESFGAYAGALATLQLAIAASDLGFSLVLLRELPNRPADGEKRLRTAVQAMTVWGLGLGVLMAGLAVARGLDTESGKALLVFAPGMAFAGLALYRVPFLVLYRTRELARMDLVLATLQTVAVVLAAIVISEVWAVAGAMVSTTAFTVLVVAFRGRHLLRDRPGTTTDLTRRSLVRAAAPLGIASLLSSLYFSIDLVLLGWLVDPEEVGLYAAAVKVLNLLVTIPGTIAPAVLPGLAVMLGPERLGAMAGRVWHWIIFAAVPPCLIVAAFPHFVVETLFGAEYLEATTVLRLLALAGVGSALATVLNVVLVALNQGPKLLRLNLAVLVLNVAANLILVPPYGIEASAAITVGTEILVCIVGVFLLRGQIRWSPALVASIRPLVAIGVAIAVGHIISIPAVASMALTVVAYLVVLIAIGGWPNELRPDRLRSGSPPSSGDGTSLVDPSTGPYNWPLARLRASVFKRVRNQGDLVEHPSDRIDPPEETQGTPSASGASEPVVATKEERPRRRSRKHLLFLVPFVVAIVVFAVGTLVPARYSATALVRVTVFAPDGPTDPTVSAENGIAAQFALLAKTPPVIDSASRTLRISSSDLDSSISAGTDSGRNLISIRSSGEIKGDVARQANAVANQLVRAANASSAQATARYTADINSRNRPLDDTIEAYRKLIASGPQALRASRAQALAALLQERQRQQSGTAASAVASAPTLQVWARAGSPTTDGLSPLLYALVGFVVAGLLAGYAVYILTLRERERSAR